MPQAILISFRASHRVVMAVTLAAFVMSTSCSRQSATSSDVPQGAADTQPPETTESASASTDAPPTRPVQTARPIPIHTVIHKSMFPEGWPGKDGFVHVTQVPAQEHARSRWLIESAMRRYPEKVLQICITDVYVVGRLVLAEFEPGGMTLKHRIYVANRGTREGYTNSVVHRTFHHEMAHNIFKLYSPHFSKRAWLDCTPGSFEYIGSVSEAVAHGLGSWRVDTDLLADGFVNEMAQSTLEEDFCHFVAELFVGSEEFWDAVAEHELLRAKLEVAIEFLNQIDPVFTEEFFRERRNARE